MKKTGTRRRGRQFAFRRTMVGDVLNHSIALSVTTDATRGDVQLILSSRGVAIKRSLCTTSMRHKDK